VLDPSLSGRGQAGDFAIIQPKRLRIIASSDQGGGSRGTSTPICCCEGMVAGRKRMFRRHRRGARPRPNSS
jgi:hypothetical protein